MFLRAPAAAATNVTGQLVVSGSWPGGSVPPVQVVVPPGANSTKVTVTVPAASPKLWWPNGMGAQNLYNVTAYFQPDIPANGGSGVNYDALASAAAAAAAATPLQAQRTVGFKHAVLVTYNDTNATFVADALKSQLEGGGHHTLMFRVNGAPLFAKGANMSELQAGGRWVLWLVGRALTH